MFYNNTLQTFLNLYLVYDAAETVQDFFNEVAAQEYIKQAKQTDLLVWQRDAAKGKRFVVAPA